MSTISTAQTHNIIGSDLKVIACGHKFLSNFLWIISAGQQEPSQQQCQIKFFVFPLTSPDGLKKATIILKEK